MSYATFLKFTNDVKKAKAFEMLRNKALNSGVLAIKATANADAKTTAAIAFTLAGVLYSLAAQATLDLSALVTKVIAAGESAAIFLFTNASGTVTAVAVDPDADGKYVCPDFDTDAKVCFGAIKLVNGTASDFTVGTTALDTTDITSTYYNLSGFYPGDSI
jgi:hypothetical protein